MYDPGFIELYKKDGDGLRFICFFERHDFGGEMPQIGDIVVAPETMAGFRDEPRDSRLHKAYEVLGRYVVPDIKDAASQVFMRLKLIVAPRELTAAEAAMWGA
jgi:hypothetical protein